MLKIWNHTRNICRFAYYGRIISCSVLGIHCKFLIDGLTAIPGRSNQQNRSQNRIDYVRVNFEICSSFAKSLRCSCCTRRFLWLIWLPSWSNSSARFEAKIGHQQKRGADNESGLAYLTVIKTDLACLTVIILDQSCLFDRDRSAYLAVIKMHTTWLS